MKKIGIAPLVIVGLPFIFSVALCLNYGVDLLDILWYLFLLTFPSICIAGVAGGLSWYAFRKKTKYAAYVFALFFFCLQMKQNILISQDLDKIAISHKERTAIIALANTDCVARESLECYRDKEYPVSQFGDYRDMVNYERKHLLYACMQKELILRLLNYCNSKKLYSEDAPCARDELIEYRKKLDESIDALLASYKQAVNFNENQLRIFKDKKWYHSSLKSDYDTLYQLQTDHRLNYIYDLYTNLRSQLFVADDLAAFLLQRENMYKVINNQLCFESKIDGIKYNDLINYRDNLAKEHQEIKKQYADFSQESPHSQA